MEIIVDVLLQWAKVSPWIRHIVPLFEFECITIPFEANPPPQVLDIPGPLAANLASLEHHPVLLAMGRPAGHGGLALPDVVECCLDGLHDGSPAHRGGGLIVLVFVEPVEEQ